MQTAWRERNPEARIKAAKDAIKINPECATGYILLAEEEAENINDAEAKFREAYKIAEANHRRSQGLQHQNSTNESQHRRDTNVMIYIRRRLAMCARKLGRLKEVRIVDKILILISLNFKNQIRSTFSSYLLVFL